MKKLKKLSLLLLICSAGWLFAEEAAPPKELKLTGTFTWNGDRAGRRGDGKNGRCNVKAVLTPTDKPNSYTAVYTFMWDKSERHFDGTFVRNPQTGEVSGTAKTGGRTWEFKGKTVNGVMACQHFETSNGKRSNDGDVAFTEDKNS